jgi:hypothetical protein
MNSVFTRLTTIEGQVRWWDNIFLCVIHILGVSDLIRAFLPYPVQSARKVKILLPTTSMSVGFCSEHNIVIRVVAGAT